MEQFSNNLCVSYEHNGAHMMPTCSGETRATVIGFLDQIRAKPENQ